MKVQQTIAACIGWRRKYQKPFELIGVGVKQFHSGERKAALATKLSSWKSAILFNARPVAREALRVKITDLVRARVRVCGACIDSKGRPFLSVFFFFFLIMNDTTKFRSSVEKVGNFRRLGRIGTSFSTGKVGWVTISAYRMIRFLSRYDFGKWKWQVKIAFIEVEHRIWSCFTW